MNVSATILSEPDEHTHGLIRISTWLGDGSASGRSPIDGVVRFTRPEGQINVDASTWDSEDVVREALASLFPGQRLSVIMGPRTYQWGPS